MAFYDRIQTMSDFFAAASRRKNEESFQKLSESTDWKTAASSWDIHYLFACRVICKPPSKVLPILIEEVENAKSKTDEWHATIKELIQGPRESRTVLGEMEETQIIRAYETGNLGCVWASLAALLQTPDGKIPAPGRILRERMPPKSPSPPFVSSSTMQVTSSSPEQRPSTSASNPSSIGYQESLLAPPLEDMTVRFASNLIRCILNYSQETDKVPLIQYRDERIVYEGSNWRAIDDGGIRIAKKKGSQSQVAMMEAKRTFRRIDDGKPTIADELLSQIVREVLAMKQSDASVFNEDIFVIVAINHYIKFLHFWLPQSYIFQFKSLKPTDKRDLATYLNVESTEWLDATDREGRRDIVHHILGLVNWADDITSS